MLRMRPINQEEINGHTPIFPEKQNRAASGQPGYLLFLERDPLAYRPRLMVGLAFSEIS